MKKQRQFSVLKFNSSRLKESKYKIEGVTPDEARKHNELIELGDNQILKVIRRVLKREVDFNDIDNLIEEREAIKKLPSNQENKNNIDKIQTKIDKYTFIPEYVAVKIDKDSHYDAIDSKGFWVNGKKYVRISCSASQARVDTVIFTDEKTYKKIFKILCNGIDFKQEIVPSKFNAYFGLYSTSTYEVTEPRVCVIKDYETKIYRPIEWITERPEGDTVERRDDIAVGCNYWDGMGIISPKMAKQWAKDLEVSYLPSNFIIRSSWVKGMVCTFDFHKFAREKASTNKITDIYGVEYDINEIDIILTESQFKLNKFYKSWQHWLENTHKNKLDWGVSRVSPQMDSEYMLTNYQFIQTLNLDKNEIEELAKPTIDWLKNILNNKDMYAALFMSGGFRNKKSVKKMLEYTENPYTQAILYNPEMIKDGYIQKKIYDSIQKKIKKAMIGKILVRGNFQMMIADPYGLCEHAFGMEIKGLLKEGEHYSYFWNKRDIKTVDAMRSPLTHYSEHNLLNLQNNTEIEEWYKYIKTGIIFNTFGLDCVLHADSDFDGDIVATTDNPYFIKGVRNEFAPITYEKKTADKAKVEKEILFMADKNAFHSTIGTITNYSTSMYAMLPMFRKDSKEYIELDRRLKILRKEQGSAIDHAKGILTNPFPKHWITYNKITEEDKRPENKEHREIKEFNNKIVADRKPYFMYHLYSNSRKAYNKFRNETNTYSRVNFGLTIDELLSKDNKNKEELDYCNYYSKMNPLNESDCVMNILCRYIERLNSEELKNTNKGNEEYLLGLMINKEFKIKNSIMKRIDELYLQFTKDKRKSITDNESLDDKGNPTIYNNITDYYYKLALKICSNDEELANYAIELDYNKYNKQNKDFTWKVCKNGVLKNIKNNNGNKVVVPILNVDGEINYLGNKYTKKEFEIND